MVRLVVLEQLSNNLSDVCDLFPYQRKDRTGLQVVIDHTLVGMHEKFRPNNLRYKWQWILGFPRLGGTIWS